MQGNVQSFIVHKASGCKDVLIVTSPYATSLGPTLGGSVRPFRLVVKCAHVCVYGNAVKIISIKLQKKF